jgi:hypothetical protein
MISKERRAELRAKLDATYEAKCKKRCCDQAEYNERWSALYASLTAAGVNPYELKLWIEEITK